MLNPSDVVQGLKEKIITALTGPKPLLRGDELLNPSDVVQGLKEKINTALTGPKPPGVTLIEIREWQEITVVQIKSNNPQTFRIIDKMIRWGNQCELANRNICCQHIFEDQSCISEISGRNFDMIIQECPNSLIIIEYQYIVIKEQDLHANIYLRGTSQTMHCNSITLNGYIDLCSPYTNIHLVCTQNPVRRPCLPRCQSGTIEPEIIRSGSGS